MRLRLECPTRPPFWIIGDPLANARAEQSPAYNIGLQVTRNTQTVTGAEFDTRMQFDRGNQGVSFDGTCNRIFDTQLERLAFIASLAPILSESQAHEWEGTAYLREDDGAAYLEYELPECTLALMGINLRGAVGLDLTYRVQAGGFGSSAEGASLISLIADATIIGPPILYLFGTATGGDVTSPVPVSNTWPGASESSHYWEITIAVYGDAGVKTKSFYFAVFPDIYSPMTGVTVLEVPIKDRLAALAANLLTADYFGTTAGFATEIVTLSGRSALKISSTMTGDLGAHYIHFTAKFGGVTKYAINVYDSESTAVGFEIDDNGVVEIADSLG